jgi:hypothetical protein
MGELFCFRIEKDSLIGDGRYINYLCGSLEISLVKGLGFIRL